MLQNKWVLALGILMLVLLNTLTFSIEKPLYYLLIIGLIFPGIPHGALDNYLLKKPLSSFKDKTIFYSLYIGIMGLIMLLWFWSPLFGLTVFLLFSAWHFGQTDNLAFGIKSNYLHFLNGSLLLAFILLSHSTETFYYLSLLGINIVPQNLSFLYTLSVFLFFIHSLLLFMFSKTSVYQLLTYLAILGICSLLPLIIGFGLYFSGVHSLNGWYAIKLGLKLSHTNLILKAGLFSILAYLFIATFLWLVGGKLLLNEQSIAWFFITLSSISIPHIIIMHFFYKQKSHSLQNKLK